MTLPDQTPLSEGRAYVDERREVVDQAMAVAEDADVPVSGTVRISHHAGNAILHTIEQYGSDAVLLGWRGQGTRRREVVLGSVVDEVVTEAPCDVFVETIGEVPETVESILLSAATGIHTKVATEVARAIARSDGARVEVTHVVPPDASDARRARGEEAIDETVEMLEGVDAERNLVEGDDVADAIVEQSAHHDLAILGATREGLLQQFVFGTIPEEVGRRAHCTVIMAKRSRGVTSKLRQTYDRIRYGLLPR